METLNQSFPLFNIGNSSNSFDDNISEKGKNYDKVIELSSSFQVPSTLLSTLRNINDARKIYALRNAINRNFGKSNELQTSSLINNDSITIPTSGNDLGINQGITSPSVNNVSIPSLIQNQFSTSISNKSNISSLTIPNEINLFNQRSIINSLSNNNNPNDILNIIKGNQTKLTGIEQLNTSIPNSFEMMDHFNVPSTIESSCTPSTTNLINNISNINTTPALLTPTLSPLNSSINIPTIQNPLYMTTALSSNINNESYDFNTQLQKKLQLLNLIKLLNARKQLMEEENKTRKINSLTIPTSLPTDTIQKSNNVFNSITVPSGIENVSSCDSNQFNNNLLNQLQIQSQIQSEQEIESEPQLSIIDILDQLKNMNSTNEAVCKEQEIKEKPFDIPSIVIQKDPSDLSLSSESSTINNLLNTNEENKNEIIDLLMPMTSKQDDINNYTPLSPELSPNLKSDNINSSNDEFMKSCIKTNENNAFSSMETLNDILTITPEMETIKTPKLEDLDNFLKEIDSIKPESIFDSLDNIPIVENVINQENDFQTLDNEFLTVPETPKSVINTPSGDLMDFSNTPTSDLMNFPNFNTESLQESNSLFNNDEMVNFIDPINVALCNENDINNNSCTSDNQQPNILENSCISNIEQIKNETSCTTENEQGKYGDDKVSISTENGKLTKRPRGRPRKKRDEKVLKSPKSPKSPK